MLLPATARVRPLAEVLAAAVGEALDLGVEAPPEQAESPKAPVATRATAIPLRVNPLKMLLGPIIDPPRLDATNSPCQSRVSRSWRAAALT